MPRVGFANDIRRERTDGGDGHVVKLAGDEGHGGTGEKWGL